MFKYLATISFIVVEASFLASSYSPFPIDFKLLSPIGFPKRAVSYSIVSMQQVSRSSVKKVLAIEQDEVGLQDTILDLMLNNSKGAGARVRRSIGTAGLKNLTPFLMLDNFKIGKGAVSFCSSRAP
jgi:hypothetical protein